MNKSTNYKTLSEMLSVNLEKSEALADQLSTANAELKDLQAEAYNINKAFHTNVPTSIRASGCPSLWGESVEHWEERLAEIEKQIPSLLCKVFKLESDYKRIGREETQIRQFMSLIQYENRYGKKMDIA